MSIRHAAGMSPEELSLLDAAIAGQKAGVMGLGAGLNPYQAGTAEHREWEKKRRSAEASFLSTFAHG